VRAHTTARLEFDRDTYTPCTSEELPSLAVKDAMMADRSDLVAGRADELLARAVLAGTTVTTIAASAAKERERTVTATTLMARDGPDLRWVKSHRIISDAIAIARAGSRRCR
jgi:hypothetical protein